MDKKFPKEPPNKDGSRSKHSRRRNRSRRSKHSRQSKLMPQ
jgi:hypothetical protein